MLLFLPVVFCSIAQETDSIKAINLIEVEIVEEVKKKETGMLENFRMVLYMPERKMKS